MVKKNVIQGVVGATQTVAAVIAGAFVMRLGARRALVAAVTAQVFPIAHHRMLLTCHDMSLFS
jgi:hypothetical protein